jgi:hypothetical protein
MDIRADNGLMGKLSLMSNRNVTETPMKPETDRRTGRSRGSSGPVL